MAKTQIGTVFKYQGTFWKVVGEPRRGGLHLLVYPVVKCNKNGREFKSRSSFDVDFVDNLLGKFQAVTDVKVSREGISSGKRKRRIAWLKASIARYQAELEKLETSDDE